MLFNGVDYGRAEIGTSGDKGKKQNRFTAGQGKTRVSDRDTESELLTYVLPRVPADQFAALDTFLTVTVNYAERPFVLTDDWGVARTVRWWDSRLKFKEKLGRFYVVTITVRVEQ